MTAKTAAGVLSNSGNSTSTQQTDFENFVAFVNEGLGAATETTLTPASGTITATASGGGIFSVDNGGAGAFNLTHISTTMSDSSSFPDGRLLLIRPGNASDPMTVKHNSGGTGSILMVDAADFVMVSLKQWLLVKRTGSNFEEVARFYGDQKAAMLTFLGALQTKRFVSSASAAITSGSVTTFAHGLGTTPVRAWLVYQCTTANAGYAIGDLVPIFPAGASADPALGLRMDATNVYVDCHVQPTFVSKTQLNASVQITQADWQVFVYAET